MNEPVQVPLLWPLAQRWIIFCFLLMQDARDRIHRRVTIEGDCSCWIWTGALDGLFGHGHAKYMGQRIKAHRLSYAIFNGPIPPGKIVRHICDRAACVNPEHLILGTQADNVQDSLARGRHRHGPGAPFLPGPKNWHYRKPREGA